MRRLNELPPIKTGGRPENTGVYSNARITFILRRYVCHMKDCIVENLPFITFHDFYYKIYVAEERQRCRRLEIYFRDQSLCPKK